MKRYIQPFKTIFLALILSFGVSYVSAWTGPTATPPANNASAPVNTSLNTQYKEGAFGVGKILVGYGGIIGLSDAGNNSISQWLGQFGATGVGANSGYVGMEFETIKNGGAAAGSPEQKLHLWTHRSGVLNSRALTIDGVGNVGINKDVPTARLEIGGVPGTDGIKFPDGTIQTTAGGGSNNFVTGTYLGNGADNREINVGFQPDDVEVGTTDTYEPMHRNKYMPDNTSQAVASGGFYSNGIKSFTANGFTVGTNVAINSLGRKYWFKAFKGGAPPVVATPVINSISISPSPIGIEQSTTISWTSSNTVSCTASNQWSGAKSASGSQSITPTIIGSAVTYTLTCYNSDGSQNDIKSATVDVRNWKATTSNGNFGESCDGWLARTGQAGVNGSVPNAYLLAGGGGRGQCVYISGGTVQGPYIAALSSYADQEWQPASWHCCGDNGQEANTSTRR